MSNQLEPPRSVNLRLSAAEHRVLEELARRRSTALREVTKQDVIREALPKLAAQLEELEAAKQSPAPEPATETTKAKKGATKRRRG